MAHRIEARDTVAVAITPPWHNLGIVTDHIMTVDEAFKLALQWRVAKEEIYRKFHGELPANANKLIGQLEKALPEGLGVILGRATKVGCLTVREDVDFHDLTGDLGLVGPDYSVIQNEAVCNAANGIIGTLDAKVETAGSLMNNRRGFLVAHLPTDISVVDDVCRPYILLSWSHDGSTALEVKFTTIRVVCWNTLSAAMADGNGIVKIKHSANVTDDSGQVRPAVIDAARTELWSGGLQAPNSVIAKAAGDYIKSQADWLNRLATAPVTDDFVRDYFQTVIPVNLKNVGQTRRDNRRAEFRSVWDGKMLGDEQKAMRLPDGQPTAYRLLQAVTMVTDHLDQGRAVTDKITGEAKSPAELRFNRITGIGTSLRDDAAEILTEALETNGQSLRDSVSKQKDEYERVVQRAASKSVLVN